MKLPDLKKLNGFVNIGKTFVAARRPEILLGMSITSTLGAVIMAAKGGYKSGQEVLREEYSDLDLINAAGKAKELDVKEKIQLTWLNYLPAAGLTAGALGSTSALHLVHVKEKKALATAALAAVDEVKRNIVTVTDEEADKMMEARANEEGVAQIERGDGLVEERYLVVDARTGRPKWSTKQMIEEALLEVNKVLNNSGDCELNHFYRHAGFNDIPDGDMLGWNDGDMITLEWEDSSLDDGRPAKAFTFRPKPQSGYDRSR